MERAFDQKYQRFGILTPVGVCEMYEAHCGYFPTTLFQIFHQCVPTLGKLFTPLRFCHGAICFGAGVKISKVMAGYGVCPVYCAFVTYMYLCITFSCSVTEAGDEHEQQNSSRKSNRCAVYT